MECNYAYLIKIALLLYPVVCPDFNIDLLHEKDLGGLISGFVSLQQ